jgi:hypothetical protein
VNAREAVWFGTGTVALGAAFLGALSGAERLLGFVWGAGRPSRHAEIERLRRRLEERHRL